MYICTYAHMYLLMKHSHAEMVSLMVSSSLKFKQCLDTKEHFSKPCTYVCTCTYVYTHVHLYLRMPITFILTCVMYFGPISFISSIRLPMALLGHTHRMIFQHIYKYTYVQYTYDCMYTKNTHVLIRTFVHTT